MAVFVVYFVINDKYAILNGFLIIMRVLYARVSSFLSFCAESERGVEVPLENRV